MSNIFKFPETNFTNFYDIARFKVAWKIMVYMSIALCVFGVFFLFVNVVNAVQYFIGGAVYFGGMLYLRSSFNYKLVSIVVAFSTAFLILLSPFIIHDVPQFIEPLWLITLLIFVYYNVGMKWGNILLSFITVFGVIYIWFFLNIPKSVTYPLTDLQLGAIIAEFLLCISVVGYFLCNAIHSTEFIENRYMEANDELNKQNKMIVSQNEEKTVLLQEIHHRVKNNLQVITSLLRLQSNELPSNEDRIHFEDAINRVMTMSLIHQKMYQAENLAELDISDYFSTLVDELIRSSSVQIPVEKIVNAEVKYIGSSSIVPLALLISELVSNSLKHAFKDFGRIFIGIYDKDDSLELVYIDNGKWKETVSDNSFGLQLIEMLTEQMDGKADRISDISGTRYTFFLKRLDN
jgi:two-component sensor histidine kinase